MSRERVYEISYLEYPSIIWDNGGSFIKEKAENDEKIEVFESKEERNKFLEKYMGDILLLNAKSYWKESL